MTIDEKKEALIESGVKVRSNASDETVEELYAEFQAEDTKPIGEPEPEEESTGIYTLADFRKFMEQNGTKQLGSKTPVVFKWALENLSNEDFNSIYAGRTVNGAKIKAK